MKKIIVKNTPNKSKYILAESIFIITESNHPRYKIGSHLDLGFLQIAVSEGYQIVINP